jgi:HEAT repeat protein
MNRTLMTIAILASLQFLTSQKAAAAFDLPSNGWASWEIPAVNDAPAWCCHEWNRAPGTKASCKLDDRDHGQGNRDDAKTDTVRIYARFANGKLERLRALALGCPVQANSEIRNLVPSEKASVEWLSDLLDDDSNADKHWRSNILSALAVHRTPLAYEALARIVQKGVRFEHRKDAVFWLAHLRGREGADLTAALMFNDADARMREHAAFALTVSVSPRIAEDLTRLATTDSERRVRGQAWFWLAQTKSPQTESVIDTALRKETDHHVREQAIFALSQLPEERATRALISVVENKGLSQADRKKALFWLGQTGSESALAYLDRIFSTTQR